MTTAFDTPASPDAQTAAEYTVTEISNQLKRVVEGKFARVRVRGEISGFKRAASGHLYFSLKDDKSVLSGICWRGVASKLAATPEDGLEVICTGKLTTYAGRSNYQMVIDSMEPAGEGALMALLEKRKRQLAAEGLFAPMRKQELPFLPQTIGVVTSPTGAVIQDILHRLGDRFPCHVLVAPVRVQGEGAAEEVAAAIQRFNTLPMSGGSIPRPDVLIVARGGGSLEDLWAFNEEIVVRAAAASHIPLISAVGHETDTTLIDYASDKRAPTPTAAAEMAVPVRADLLAYAQELDTRRLRAMTRLLETLSHRVEGLARGLPRPQDVMGMAAQRLDDITHRLTRALEQTLHRREQSVNLLASRIVSPAQRLQQKQGESSQLHTRLHQAMRHAWKDKNAALQSASRLLDSLSYTQVLARGYAVATGAGGKPITSAAALQPGDALRLRFADGETGVVVE